MKIKITSDSTCDLSPELIEKYNIAILPLYVVMGDDNLKDGEEATPEDIYSYVDKTGVLPKTSAPNLSDYTDLFQNISMRDMTRLFILISAQIFQARTQPRALRRLTWVM